jgi:hypothetical protein
MKFFKDILDDRQITLSNFYGIKIEPDPKYKRKLAQSIETLGDRYVLYKPVERNAK